jgi:hypothetical protein
MPRRLPAAARMAFNSIGDVVVTCNATKYRAHTVTVDRCAGSLISTRSEVGSIHADPRLHASRPDIGEKCVACETIGFSAESRKSASYQSPLLASAMLCARAQDSAKLINVAPSAAVASPPRSRAAPKHVHSGHVPLRPRGMHATPGASAGAHIHPFRNNTMKT